MSWSEMLDPVFTERLCLTLLHSLWQVAALTVVALWMDRLTQSTSAARSYVMYTSALIIALAALPITWCIVDVVGVANIGPSELAVAEPKSDASRAVIQGNADVALDDGSAIGTGKTMAHTHPSGMTPFAANNPIRPESRLLSDAQVARLSITPWPHIASWVVTVYLAGVTLMLLRLSLSMIRSNRLCRDSRLIKDGPLAEILQALSRQWAVKVMQHPASHSSHW